MAKVCFTDTNCLSSERGDVEDLCSLAEDWGGNQMAGALAGCVKAVSVTPGEARVVVFEGKGRGVPHRHVVGGSDRDEWRAVVGVIPKVGVAIGVG